MSYLCRATNLSGIIELVSALNGDAETLLKRAGLSKRVFSADDALISYTSQVGILEMAAREYGYDFALKLAQHQDMTVANDLVGLFSQTFSNIGEAMRAFIENYDRLDQGGQWYLGEHDALAWFGYKPRVWKGAAAEQLTLFNLCKAMFFFRKPLGRRWQPNAVHLRFSLPQHSEYHHFFDCPLLCDTDDNAILFQRRVLTTEMPGNNPEARTVLKHALERLSMPQQRDIVELVRQLIAQLLPLGQATQANIAGILGVHRRTLLRRLQTRGTSFRQVVIDVRIGIAKEQLVVTQRSVADIANQVGYQHVSGFCRAFEARAGCSPGVWRLRNSGLHAPFQRQGNVPKW